MTSPIVGTVNLRGAQQPHRPGALDTLPDSETEINNGTARHSAAVERDGDVRVRPAGLRRRAARVPRLQARCWTPRSRPGYRFAQDGRGCGWLDAGRRRAQHLHRPAGIDDDDAIRPTTTSSSLDDYLGVNDTDALIDWIRAQPLGAVVGSTPAFLDPPSLDPPPDADYPGFVMDNKERRSLIFVGANDGMLHAHRRPHRRRSLGVHSVQPAAQAESAALRPVARRVQVLRRQLAENRRRQSRRRMADVPVHRPGARAARTTTRSTSRSTMADFVAEDRPSTARCLTYFSTPAASNGNGVSRATRSFDAHASAPYGELSAASAIDDRKRASAKPGRTRPLARCSPKTARMSCSSDPGS